MFRFKYLLMSLDKFFFEERPTDGIAVFRILWMTMLLIYFLLDLGNIEDFYGPQALLSLSTVKEQFPYFHLNIFHLFDSSYSFIYGMLIVYGFSLIFSILGFYTRQSLIISFLCMVSLHQRNIWLLSSSEVLIRIITLLLICSPCGHSLSFDAILGRFYPHRQQKREWSVWCLRLIQMQICVVYLWTVWHKLKGETWFNGSAVYYATRLENMTNFPVPYFLDSIPFLRLATWGTLALELALGTLIWFEEFRKPLIILGILFHIGIEYVMSIPFFELSMIVLLLNFFTPEEHRVFAQKFSAYVKKFIEQAPLLKNAQEKVVHSLKSGMV
jgi:hypothetical protein